jgi:hypothetical protein
MEPVAFCDWFGSLEVAICDLKAAASFPVKLKHKIGRKSLQIPFHLLVWMSEVLDRAH